MPKYTFIWKRAKFLDFGIHPLFDRRTLPLLHLLHQQALTNQMGIVVPIKGANYLCCYLQSAPGAGRSWIFDQCFVGLSQKCEINPFPPLAPPCHCEPETDAGATMLPTLPMAEKMTEAAKKNWVSFSGGGSSEVEVHPLKETAVVSNLKYLEYSCGRIWNNIFLASLSNKVFHLKRKHTHAIHFLYCVSSCSSFFSSR